MPQDPRQVMQAWTSLIHVGSYLELAASQMLREELGLSLVEYYALHHLSAQDTRMVDLADGLSMTKGGITKMVDRLEQEGLVERLGAKEDRRVILTRATPAGRDAFMAATRLLLGWVKENFLPHQSKRDLKHINDALAKLLKAWGRWEMQKADLERHAKPGRWNS